MKSPMTHREAKMGICYADIHQYIRLGTCGDAAVDAKIRAREAANLHKRRMPVILNPFGAKDNSQVELTDITEGDAYYEAVRFVFEEGLMQPVSEDTFGVAENVTVGDWAVALFQLLGGAGSAEEAVGALAQFGILAPDADPANTMTRTDLIGSCNILCQAAGVQSLDTELPASENENATRGDAALMVLRLNEAE